MKFSCMKLKGVGFASTKEMEGGFNKVPRFCKTTRKANVYRYFGLFYFLILILFINFVVIVAENSFFNETYGTFISFNTYCKMGRFHLSRRRSCPELGRVWNKFPFPYRDRRYSFLEVEGIGTAPKALPKMSNLDAAAIQSSTWVLSHGCI